MAVYHDLLIMLITEWGDWAVAIGMALESACLPVPSEIVLPMAGYLVAIGKLTFFEATLAAMIGGLAGSILAYWLGRVGGRPFILKYGRRLFINDRVLNRADSWVEKYGDHAAFWARLFPVVRTFISLPLGIAKMPFGRFVLYSVAGMLPWTIALIYAGQQLGENWASLLKYGDWANVIVVIVLLLGLVIVGWKIHHSNK